MIKIVKIALDAPDFLALEAFGKQIYPADSIRQNQPESFNRTHFHTALAAVENGQIRARLVVYRNPNLQFQGQKIVTVGNYESVDDRKVSNKILNEALKIAKNLGADLVLGPMNGSTWDNYRFSTSHAHDPFFTEQVHHLYYNQQFLDNGFSVFGNYFSSRDTNLPFDHHPPVLEREQAFLAQGVTFRSIDLANFDDELERLFTFNHRAFQTNFLYSPIEKTDFLEKYKFVQKIIDPNFVRLAEDKDKNLLGYFFCIKDFYNQKEKSLILKTIARDPDPRWAGMGHVIGNQIYRKVAESGFDSVIHAFMYSAGYSTTITKNFLGEPYKFYALYGKKI